MMAQAHFPGEHILRRRLHSFFACALAASTAGVAFAARPALAVTVAPSSGVIGSLHTIATIGSTIDPVNGDRNPYGLTIAPAAGGMINAGDLVVCNFNDSLNIQGLGTTIDLLAPVAGSKPRHLIADPRLTGCAAIAMGSANPWIAALDANDNPIVSGQGQLVTPINNFGWTGPWGQVFVAGPKSPAAAFYESNTNDGSIVRINLGSNFTFDTIATGFPVNHGVPGSILAPSGLTYDAQRDVLYVVDGAVNALIAISNPATIPNGGIVVRNGYIGGPDRARVKILFRGAPLAAPISAALLFDGHIVVGNTANNRLIEFAPDGSIAGSRVLDRGAAGALFGLAASGTSAQTTRIYFNDDNDNTVKVLSH
jgi:hypothetical protein